MSKTKIWSCKIGETDVLPQGADHLMRNAVASAYYELTHKKPEFIFSGWGAELTEPERAVVENRLPDPDKCAGQLPSLSSIREAVARGWCHPGNTHKEMDSALADAIAQEVQRLFERGNIEEAP